MLGNLGKYGLLNLIDVNLIIFFRVLLQNCGFEIMEIEMNEFWDEWMKFEFKKFGKSLIILFIKLLWIFL